MMHPAPDLSTLFCPEDEALSAEAREQIQLYRLLLLLGILLLPLFGLSAPSVPGTTDPMWVRLGAAGLLAGLFGASYGSGWVRRNYVLWVRGILYLVMGGLAVLAALNRFADGYETSLLLVYALLIMVVWAGARSMGPVLRFAGLGLLRAFAAAKIGSVPTDNALVVLASMATVAAVEATIIQASLSNRNELRDREERLRSITENVSDGIYRSVPGDGIVYANRAFVEMFGYERVEDVLQLDPAVLYGDAEERERRLQDLRTQRSFDAHEVDFRRKDGTTFTGLLSGTVVRGPEGEVKCYDGAITDITEQKEAERTLQEEKTVLRRMYRTTADRDASFESKVRRLLELGREYLGLPSVVEASWSQVGTARATLRTETNVTVRADEKRLKRLFENLFRNAVEHGREDVVVRVGDLPTGFFVEDDGPGIPAEKRKAVFEEGCSSTSDGTGLGLSIVETVADAHGWALSATEGPAGGARFEIEGVDIAEKSLLTE